MSQERFLKVRNFEKFQHYAHRNPPWIRLYRDLLGDKNFYKLDGVLKFQIIGMFLLASQCENKISADAEWIQSQLKSVEPVSLQALIQTGFVEERKQRASTMPAPRKQVAPKSCSETDSSETETDIQSREKTEMLALGQFGWVKLTRNQYAALKTQLNGHTDTLIAEFDGWVQEAPEAKASGVRRRDRDPYASLQNWYRRKVGKGEIRGPTATLTQAERDEIHNIFRSGK